LIGYLNNTIQNSNGDERITTRNLWACPQCGNTFTSPNMWHSCGQYELETLFARSEPQVLELCEKFIALAQEVCGMVTVIPQKTRMVLQARVRFVACYPRKKYILCHFWFARRAEHPRFVKIEELGPRAVFHYTRIETGQDLDETFTGWLREAYRLAVG
jgi:hypothetical protein